MKYTLITGASAGIGKAMAFTFAANGHNLILVARREKELNQIKNEINSEYGVDVIVKHSDLSEKKSTLDLYEAVKQNYIEVWINNAGYGDYNKAWAADVAKISTMIDLNVRALTTLSLMYMNDYKDEKTQLINVSSGFGYFIFSDAVTYSATKFFVSAFTEGIAQNLKDEGCKMQVKLLAPAAVNTEFEVNAVVSSDFDEHDWKNAHTAEEMAQFTYELYKGDKIVGAVNHETHGFELKEPIYPYN